MSSHAANTYYLGEGIRMKDLSSSLLADVNVQRDLRIRNRAALTGKAAILGGGVLCVGVCAGVVASAPLAAMLTPMVGAAYGCMAVAGAAKVAHKFPAAMRGLADGLRKMMGGKPADTLVAKHAAEINDGWGRTFVPSSAPLFSSAARSIASQGMRALQQNRVPGSSGPLGGHIRINAGAASSASQAVIPPQPAPEAPAPTPSRPRPR